MASSYSTVPIGTPLAAEQLSQQSSGKSLHSGNVLFKDFCLSSERRTNHLVERVQSGTSGFVNVRDIEHSLNLHLSMRGSVEVKYFLRRAEVFSDTSKGHPCHHQFRHPIPHQAISVVELYRPPNLFDLFYFERHSPINSLRELIHISKDCEGHNPKLYNT